MMHNNCWSVTDICGRTRCFNEFHLNKSHNTTTYLAGIFACSGTGFSDLRNFCYMWVLLSTRYITALPMRRHAIIKEIPVGFRMFSFISCSCILICTIWTLILTEAQILMLPARLLHVYYMKRFLPPDSWSRVFPPQWKLEVLPKFLYSCNGRASKSWIYIRKVTIHIPTTATPWKWLK